MAARSPFYQNGSCLFVPIPRRSSDSERKFVYDVSTRDGRTKTDRGMEVEEEDFMEKFDNFVRNRYLEKTATSVGDITTKSTFDSSVELQPTISQLMNCDWAWKNTDLYRTLMKNKKKLVTFVKSVTDLRVIVTSFYCLEQSGFYHGGMTAPEAEVLLRTHPVGTFLIRDSSDPGHLFTFTVNTIRGTTSTRVVYENEHFRLDCSPGHMHLAPSFDNVVKLAEYHSRSHDRVSFDSSSSGHQRFSSSSSSSADASSPAVGMTFTDDQSFRAPAILRRPLRTSPGLLKHLCRLTINGALAGNDVDRLCLIPSLKNFLKDYPYTM